LKDNSKKVITKINSTIQVPKDKTYQAIEEGIRLGKKSSTKIRIYPFIPIVALAAIAMIIIIHTPMVDALANIPAILGAKLTKVEPGETKETAPVTIKTPNHAPESTETIKPIKLIEGTEVTQQLLMTHAWAPLMNSISGEPFMDIVDSKVVIHRFNANELLLSFVDIRTGQEISEADTIYYDDKNEPIESYKELDKHLYKIQGNILEQQVLFSSKRQSDPTYMELRIVDGLLVMFPHDDFDHKKDRQLILQAVEIVPN